MEDMRRMWNIVCQLTFVVNQYICNVICIWRIKAAPKDFLFYLQNFDLFTILKFER